MRIVLERVSHAQVSVNSHIKGSIGAGLVLFIGIHHNDDATAIQYGAEKCAHLRIFADAAGKMNHSVLDIKGSILAISQFTLYGDSRRGRRPGFSDAAPPHQAAPLYQLFIEHLQNFGLPVATGVFGADMQVEIHNDGPVTLIIESP